MIAGDIVVSHQSVTNSEITCDGVSLSVIADAVGTPVYVYSASAIRASYGELDRAFGDHPHAVHYALKANSTLAIARLLKGLGSAADANSIWEIEVARRAGFAPSEIVFTGVGKALHELESAVGLGLKAINVESAGELARIEALASRSGIVARIAVRLNPDIDAKSHPHISTGLGINKFGVPLGEAEGLFASLRQRPALNLVAIHVHVGSQITSIEPIQRAAELLAVTADTLRRDGHRLEYLDMGGGLGISYDGREVPTAGEYVAAALGAARGTRLPIVVEPGRSIVAAVGTLVARVIDLKPRTPTSDFAVIDAGMTELMRPALYNAFHRIEAIRPRRAPERQYEVVGPVCESSDVMGWDRALPQLEVGDLIAIRDAGAYGAVMASNYNRRPLPPEVLVDEGAWRVIRRRQSIDDQLAMES